MSTTGQLGSAYTDIADAATCIVVSVPDPCMRGGSGEVAYIIFQHQIHSCSYIVN